MNATTKAIFTSCFGMEETSSSNTRKKTNLDTGHDDIIKLSQALGRLNGDQEWRYSQQLPGDRSIGTRHRNLSKPGATPARLAAG
jgi:hypothetical protein